MFLRGDPAGICMWASARPACTSSQTTLIRPVHRRLESLAYSIICMRERRKQVPEPSSGRPRKTRTLGWQNYTDLCQVAECGRQFPRFAAGSSFRFSAPQCLRKPSSARRVAHNSHRAKSLYLGSPPLGSGDLGDGQGSV